MSEITERILKEINDPDLLKKLSSLSQSDLTSLLLEVNKLQIQKLTPPNMINAYKSNRFSWPSQINPADFHTFEAELLNEAERQGIEGIMLSPAAPLGSCSVFGCVDQNNVVSALRGTEVLSDPTNMLAIILADQIKNGELDNKIPAHFCTSCRVMRASMFTGKRSFPHFGIFCIVSVGKDTGSYTCERELLAKQLSYYKQLFDKKYNAKLSAVLRKRSGYTDNDGFFARMTDLIKSELPDMPITIDEEHIDNAYYKGINYKINMHINDETIEIGDGGFVDWTQRLLSNKKERCLISGIGLDRLLMLER